MRQQQARHQVFDGGKNNLKLILFHDLRWEDIDQWDDNLLSSTRGNRHHDAHMERKS